MVADLNVVEGDIMVSEEDEKSITVKDLGMVGLVTATTMMVTAPSRTTRTSSMDSSWVEEGVEEEVVEILEHAIIVVFLDI